MVPPSKKFKNRIQKGRKTGRKGGPRSGASDTDLDSTSLLPTLTNLTRKEIIAKYHTLNKQLAAIENKQCWFPNEAARDSRRRIVEAQLRVIGGIEKYQEASIQGEEEHGGFDTSQWVLRYLRENECEETKAGLENGRTHLNLLDVGSIVDRFPKSVDRRSKEMNLNVTCIDLRPADGQNVIQADLIDFANISSNQRAFDIVCLCLCINFEGCAKRRGDMLHSVNKLLSLNGLLFIALPLPCIDNSRYVDENRFRDILEHLGYRLYSTERTSKLWLGVAQRVEERKLNEVEDELLIRFGKKEIVRGGVNRNNFAVLLGDGDSKNDDSSNGREQNVTKKKKIKKYTRSTHQGDAQKPVALTSNQRKRARKRNKQKFKGSN